ncbi:MAG: histidine--tRNA ligase [Endomicrobium sp.]|jgi:histidyl-tRNA synthetase|nr:histidine--tRNA ligase [Endomicrobium sp.]
MKKKMNYKAPRGTHDILSTDALGMSFLELKAREIFKKHGFEEIRTPLFEDAALFMHSIGRTTDIVEKEMYTFEDKKGRKLALRPEGTASLVRAFIEHRMDTIIPSGKFFYMGEMFRYERPQSGRYRQFHQIGAEFFGNQSPVADAEIIILVQDLLFAAGIDEIDIRINSLGCKKCRPSFRETLIEYFSSLENLCKDCLKRLKKNPLRLFDCKIDSLKFVKAPKILNYICTSCKNNFYTLQTLLKSVNCSYNVDETLVRGLDYYTQTVFEICSKKNGAYGTVIAAGGRYDNLVKELGGQDIPAVGFALGSQRVLSIIDEHKLLNNFGTPERIFIAVIDQELFNEAFSFAVKISRYGLNNNKNISVFGPKNEKNLTNQLKYAEKIKASKVLVFAKNEFKNGKLLIKDMNNRTQTENFIDEL